MHPSASSASSSTTTKVAVRRFALGLLVAAVAIAIGGYLALRSVALDEAKRDTARNVAEAAQLVEAEVDDGILTGEASSIAAVDDLVLTRVLSPSVVRVRLWSASGRVLYSDDAVQIGRQYELEPDQLALLRSGGAEVQVSNLDRPENERDRGEGKLIEAYAAIRAPDGTPVLFEIYERFDSVSASAERLLWALAPPLLVAFGLIVLVQAPLVWSLARRLRRGHEEREHLLARAIDASSRERRRVASYLHDGAVQDIAGVAYGLSPLADAAVRRGDKDEAVVLRTGIDSLRQCVRDLRTLLVDLHPPHLAAGGLAAAIDDLASPLTARGVDVSLRIEDAERLTQDHQALAFRVVQEAIRNVLAYAEPTAVSVTLAAANGHARLVVRDDGRGFSPEQREARRTEGHLGLGLLEELAEQVGGTLTVVSEPGAGTSIELEVTTP